MKRSLLIILIFCSCSGGGGTPNYANVARSYENGTGTYERVIIGDSFVYYNPFWQQIYHEPLDALGIPGDTTYGVLDRLQTVVDRNPSIVTLWIGYNNLAIGWTAKETAAEIQDIVTNLNEQGIEVEIISVLFTGDGQYKDQIAELNDLIKAMPIKYIDLNAKLAPNGYLLRQYWDSPDDCVHINDLGYMQLI